ncbi:MAG: hypothetical protein H0X66_07590 [Verrucomicrobia bacterium]|nr:hypothetical protein [Verrucomicrobiota bacterium]
MRKVRGIILVLAFATAISAWAQRSSDWRTFKVSDGLAESFVTSVSVGQRSNVWVKHFDADAVSHLNGYRTRTIPGPHRGAYRIHESRSGQLWAAHTEGLQEFKNGMWIRYPVDEIRQEFQTTMIRNVRSIPIIPLRQGHVLFLLFDQLMEFKNEWPPQSETKTLRHVSQTRLEKFSDMTLGRDGTFWIIGKHGILRLASSQRITDESVWEEFLIDPALEAQDLQQAFADDAGGLTAVAESTATGRKVIVHFDGESWFTVSPGNHRIRQAWKTPDGRFWAVSINSLLRQEWDGTWGEDRDVPAIQFFDVATEANGVFWLATSEGLLRHSPALWQSPTGLRPNVSSIRSIGERSDGSIWMASAEGVTVRQGQTWHSLPFPEIPEQPFRSGEFIFPLKSGKLVTGVDGNLLCLDPVARTYSTRRHPSGAPLKPLGLLGNRNLCVQVMETEETLRLEVFDGERFSAAEFPEPPFPAKTGLLILFATTVGEMWLSSDSGLARYTKGNWQLAEIDSAPEWATCFVEMNNGKIWCGTRDSIWEFDGKTWGILRTGFDRVNAITQSRDGIVWVASNGGLFRFQQGEWTDYAAQDGLPSNAITDVFEDRTGQIWAGATRGAAIFLPRSDMDEPRSFITKIETGQEDSVTISFGGADRWKVTTPEQLLFSHRLDEKEWSPFSPERTVSFHNLSAGTHYFQVRAMDRNRNIDPQPALLDFEVRLPWYQETRLVLITLAGLGVAVFFASLAFNRHRRLQRSYAEVEKIVALRTKQLEQANAQLLHSQKMTALGALAAGVAHDFNSILSIIKGSAQIIEANLSDRTKIKIRTERIKTAVEQGSEVIKAMLGFSRPADNDAARCDLNRLISDTIKLLGDRFERDIQVMFTPSQSLPDVFKSPNLIQQILLNFIFNAADALDGKGKIEIRVAQARELPPNPVLLPEEAQDYVAISVCDSGCGISSEMLPRVFEPFFTTKALSSRRGTGLGLSMAYELAKEMGCGLSVESVLGKGSSFTVIIPVKNSGADTPIDSRDGAEIPQHSNSVESTIKKTNHETTSRPHN